MIGSSFESVPLKSNAIARGRVPGIGRPSYAARTVPASAFALALTAAFLHAFWNLLLARSRDPQAATAIALVSSVVVFAPVTAVVWRADPRVWPFILTTSLLQLLYFALLA